MPNYVQRLLARAAGRPGAAALRPVVSLLPWRKGAEPPITDLVEDVPGTGAPLPASAPRAAARSAMAHALDEDGRRGPDRGVVTSPSEMMPAPSERTPAPPWRTPLRAPVAEAEHDTRESPRARTAAPRDPARPLDDPGEAREVTSRPVTTASRKALEIEDAGGAAEAGGRSGADDRRRAPTRLERAIDVIPGAAPVLAPRSLTASAPAEAASTTEPRRAERRGESAMSDRPPLQPRRPDPASAPAAAPPMAPPQTRPSRRESRATTPVMTAPESRRSAPMPPPAPRLVIGRLTVEVTAPAPVAAAPRRPSAAPAAAPASASPRSSYRFGLGQV